MASRQDCLNFAFVALRWAYVLDAAVTRGREYEGSTPSQLSIASTVVALSVEPLSPCNTGLSARAAMPSASAVRRTR